MIGAGGPYGFPDLYEALSGMAGGGINVNQNRAV